MNIFAKRAALAVLGSLVVVNSLTVLGPARAFGAGPSARADIILGAKSFRPWGLDIDEEGNIYVGGGDEIWVYDKAGNRTAVWQFRAPRPVRVGPDGNIYVGRTWEPVSRVRVYNKAGVMLREFGQGKWLHGDAVGFDVPFDLAFDPNGNVWSPNTHSVTETERRKDCKNTAWGAVLESDENGGRIMFFDLRRDPQGRRPQCFGTFSNTPPEAGGPPDALHLPKRIAFDPVHKKLFVMDVWGVTRWSWPDGAFEKRIIRHNVYVGEGLLAVTPKGTLYVRLDRELEEYDWEGAKLAELKQIDVSAATDLRVTSDGSIYVCPGRNVAFKKYTPDGKLVLCRGLNVITLELQVADDVLVAGEMVPVKATIRNREELYGIKLPGLDEVRRSLWIRPYAADAEWRRLDILPGKAGEEFFVVPEGIAGACELTLSASPAAAELMDETAAAVTVRVAVRDPKVENGTISVCTDRGQRLFAAGGWVRVNVIGRAVNEVPPEEVRVWIAAPGRKAAVETSGVWSVPAGGSSTLPVDAHLPRHARGDFTVHAASAALGEATFPIRVVPPREKGRFKLLTGLGLGTEFTRRMCRKIVQIASDDGISHDVTRYISAGYIFGTWGRDLQVNEQMRQLLASDPRLPAPETAELPSRMRAALNEMGVGGMHIWPEVMGWELDTLNRTEKQDIQDRKNLARWTQWGRRSPAQDGFLWNESNWWKIDHDRLKRDWSAATGRPVEQLDAIGRFFPLQERNPLLSGEKLDAMLSYQEFAAKALYPASYRRWKEYVQTMRPGITGAAVPAFYWFNWPHWCSEPLDVVVSYHQVEQVCEPWMQLNDCAFFRRDGKPFYAGVELYPDSGTGEYLARQLLPALLYGVEGFWANGDHIAKAMSGFNRGAHVHQAMADLRAVLEPVGARLRHTRCLPELGIYYPRAARVQGGNFAFRGAMYHKRVSAALIASYHAHLPAQIVFDEDLKAGNIGRVRYLLLPGLQSDITPADHESLRKFREAGGRVLVGAGSAPQYSQLGPAIDVDFDIFEEYDYYQWFANDTIIEKRRKVIELAGQMRAALAEYVRPAVQIDDPDVWYALREGQDNRGREVTYLVAVNQNGPEMLTPNALWKMTSFYDVIMPVVRRAVVPGKYRFGYDLLRGRAFEIDGGAVSLDFRRFPGPIRGGWLWHQRWMFSTNARSGS